MRLVLSCPCQMSFTHGSAMAYPMNLSNSWAGMQDTKAAVGRATLATLDSMTERGKLCVEPLTYTMEEDGVLSISEDLENLLQFVA